MTKSNTIYFYHDKPVFGLDIGFSSLKVLQLHKQNKKYRVTGYGVAQFDPKAIKNGEIIDFEAVANVAKELFMNQIVGEITTRRVCISVPSAHSFSRIITLPKIKNKDLRDAINLETEQYIPVPIDELYIDFKVIDSTKDQQEILVVAVPKKIVNSFVNLAEILGLEVVAVETAISALSRSFVQAGQSDVPTVLIDIGPLSADITIYDKNIVVTGTVSSGGDSFTQAISERLHVTMEESNLIKIKYGLGVSKKQSEITSALDPLLADLLKEIGRMIRYYEERSGTQRKIQQVVTMGGGANMPGLSEHLTNILRLPVRMCNPWQNISFGKLQQPSASTDSLFVTVAGLALVNPKEIYKS